MAKKVTKKTVAKKTPAKKKAATRKRTVAKKASPTVSAEQVRVRAYEIFCSGRNTSNPDADWVQAEQELASELRA